MDIEITVNMLLTEGSKEVDPKVIDKVAKLVAINHHTEAYIEVAKVLKHKKLEKIFTLLSQIFNIEMHMPPDIGAYHDRLLRTDLKSYMYKVLTRESADALWGAL